MAYTYMVECVDGTLYTGWTNGLGKRIICHNEGRGAKYTRSRRPVRLVYYEVFATKQEAMRREYAIKRLERKDKLALIAGRSEEVGQTCEDINQRGWQKTGEEEDNSWKTCKDADEKVNGNDILNKALH